jgi:signal transduction histidine kinase
MNRMDLSLLLALLGACVLVGLNEMGFRESSESLAQIDQAQQTRGAINRLLQDILDGETGQRGYLLTGDARYLEPYVTANADIGLTMEVLRSSFSAHAEDIAHFNLLSQHLARKLAEMEITVRMRQQGKDEAWKFVLTTDVGKEQMDAIRAQANGLLAASTARLQDGQARIIDTLRLARLGVAGMAALGLLAFYLYLRQTRALNLAGLREQESLKKERDALEEQVRQRTVNLAELATHLQLAREDERGHLARELHDELGALLTAAKLDVARLKSRIGGYSTEATDRLVHLTETLNSGIALKRRIVEDLRPSALTHLGLTASLEILTREYAESAGLQITCDLESAALDEASQLTVYRLVQESLTNVAKYAQATHVQISLHNFDGYVMVDVADDGHGFDPAQGRPSSYGLAGMRHRVQACGGRLTVTSEPGRGTRISAVIPRTA